MGFNDDVSKLYHSKSVSIIEVHKHRENPKVNTYWCFLTPENGNEERKSTKNYFEIHST